MASFWISLYPASIAQILLCDRSANYSISWRCSIGLFTLSLFQKKEEHLI